jgi:hypothetical protein
MVEVAEGFVAEGGGAAAVVVGEEVVAGRGWDDFHGWGLAPGYFGRKVLRESVGFGRFRVKSEGPGPARTARDFAWLSVARDNGL